MSVSGPHENSAEHFDSEFWAQEIVKMSQHNFWGQKLTYFVNFWSQKFSRILASRKIKHDLEYVWVGRFGKKYEGFNIGQIKRETKRYVEQIIIWLSRNIIIFFIGFFTSLSIIFPYTMKLCSCINYLSMPQITTQIRKSPKYPKSGS